MKKIILSIYVSFGFVTQALAAEMFYQDDDYIYRSVPHSIDVTNKSIMSRLGQAATLDILDKTGVLLADLGRDEQLTELQKVEKEIKAFFDTQENLDALNLRVEAVKKSDRLKGFKVRDLLPKAITFFVGYSGAISRGIGGGMSLSVGLTFMMDKVDRIAKADLVNVANSSAPLTLEEVEELFGEMRADFKDEFALLMPFMGIEREVVREDGSVIKVWSNYEWDIAPVFIAAPAVGFGIAAGKSWRVGVSLAWWRKNNIMEPEDLRGYGLALSSDVMAFGWGANVKLGLVNSDSISGAIPDYVYGSFAFALGPHFELSPVKINALVIKDPLWVLDMIGLEARTNQYLTRNLNIIANQEWSDITGLPVAGPQRPGGIRQPGTGAGGQRTPRLIQGR